MFSLYKNGRMLAFVSFIRNYQRRFSFSRFTSNYSQKSLETLRESYETERLFRHPFFEFIRDTYQSELENLDLKKTLQAANEILLLPLIEITEKQLTPPSGVKTDYLSFKPYCWLDANVDPLQKLKRTPEWKDGRPNPYLADLSDKPKLAQVCSRIHLLSLAYLISSEQRYLQHAKKQIQTWFLNSNSRMSPHMDFAQLMPWSGQQKGLGIIDSRWLILMIEGVIIFGPDQVLSDKQLQALADWLQAFAIWILASFSGRMEVSMKNNRGSWVDALLVYISLALNKECVARNITQHGIASRPVEQLNKKFKQHLELSRYTFIGYSLYNIFPLYHLATFADWDMKNGNPKFISNGYWRKVRLLIRSASRLQRMIPEQEKGKIESIPFKVTNDLNLFYPYSLEQLSSFPAILPYRKPQSVPNS